MGSPRADRESMTEPQEACGKAHAPPILRDGGDSSESVVWCELRKGIRLKFPRLDLVADGNVGSSGRKSVAHRAVSGALLAARENSDGRVPPTPGRTHNRIRSPSELPELLSWREQVAPCWLGDELGTFPSGDFPRHLTTDSELGMLCGDSAVSQAFGLPGSSRGRVSFLGPSGPPELHPAGCAVGDSAVSQAFGFPRSSRCYVSFLGPPVLSGLLLAGCAVGYFDGTPEQMRGSRETLASPRNRSRILQKCLGAGRRMAMRRPKERCALIEERYGVWGFRHLVGVRIPRDLSWLRKLFGGPSTPEIASRRLCCRVFDGTPEQMRGSHETLASPSNRSRKLQKCCGTGTAMALRRHEERRVLRMCGALIEEHCGVWGFRRLARVRIPRELSQLRKLFGAHGTPEIASRQLCCCVFDGTPEQMPGSRETLAFPSNRSRKLQKYCEAGTTMAIRRHEEHRRVS
ncbi:hypothetical protein AXF42_Ash013201 [Apostasia shenzhenica]|uniref:Uncharacterized protein n=1 Tax=Apostasia shenzhenica TaxID=1088818 RepID=A0A2I0BBB1_9ASPA|nr:hypothetical protein AXF42_Ash013201 [Apostasia shenzhenica]